MNKAILLMVFCMLSLVAAAWASQEVDIVVVGMINHGPMQPTVDAIRNVTSSYPEVNVTWLDLETEAGQDYAQAHGLSAHLNILIDGRYQYDVNGKEVTFQWFEGQEWTKDDLDAVISGLVRNDSSVSSQSSPSKGNMNVVIIVVAVFAVIGLASFFLVKKLKT